jgi:hypothetical protein
MVDCSSTAQSVEVLKTNGSGRAERRAKAEMPAPPQPHPAAMEVGHRFVFVTHKRAIGAFIQEHKILSVTQDAGMYPGNQRPIDNQMAPVHPADQELSTRVESNTVLCARRLEYKALCAM